jgi:hypothetical protein
MILVGKRKWQRSIGFYPFSIRVYPHLFFLDACPRRAALRSFAQTRPHLTGEPIA